MSETALAVLESAELEKPGKLMRHATDAAAACREIVLRTAMELQGRKYVKVEGWESIAAVYGCVPSIRIVEQQEYGIRAVAELKRSDGTVVAEAEGFCGIDEPRWANQPMYARRGMAQTRAVSRVCRTAFAFVVTLIDSNLQTTPAEEIPQGGESLSVTPPPAPASGRRMQIVDVKPGQPEPERSKATKVRYGKAKDQFLCDIPQDDLDWQFMAAEKSVAAKDPKWGEAHARWLESVKAEIARRKA